MLNVNKQQPIRQEPQKKDKKPNDVGSISVQAHLRIFDPKTQKTYMEGRG